MDVDLDTKTSFDPKSVFPQIVRATVVNNSKKEISPHTCGVYFQPIPKDPISGLAAIPYKEAEDIGYEKIDFLHLTLLDYFESNEEIDFLLEREPDWMLLLDPEVVGKLFHLGTRNDEGKLKHFPMLLKVAPRSVQQLADCLALIRPGKGVLIDKYVKSPETVRELLYKQDNGVYAFKRSHAIAYALNIVLQLHLIKLDVI